MPEIEDDDDLEEGLKTLSLIIAEKDHSALRTWCFHVDVACIIVRALLTDGQEGNNVCIKKCKIKGKQT